MQGSNAARMLMIGVLFAGLGAYGEAVAPSKPQSYGAPTAINKDNPAATAVNAATPGEIKPYRTFITLMRYTMEQNGEVNNPISNVKIDVNFPNKLKLSLPEGGQWWPIGNGQVQEINRTFELPWAYVQNDGFKFEIQMYRKGSKMLPCQFEVTQLSQFNRAYVCHTDLNWQQGQNTPPEKQDKEGIQIRVFTDKNAEPKDIPKDAIALK